MNKAVVLTALVFFTGFGKPMHADRSCTGWMTEAFFSAAKVQDIRNCLESGANLAERDDEGRTPLHLAAATAQNAAVVAELLRAGADTELTDAEGRRPIHLAAGKAHTPGILSYLIIWGSDPDIQLPGEYCSWSSFTRCATAPLHLAAARADGAEYVAALLAADADPDLRDEDGRSALQHAAANAPDVLNVALLLQAGASEGISDFDGRTPLHMAARRGEGAPEIITALLDAGASADAGDDNGVTPVIWAARTAPDSMIVEMLIDATSDPCAADEKDRTVFIAWAQNDKLEQDSVYWALHDQCSE